MLSAMGPAERFKILPLVEQVNSKLYIQLLISIPLSSDNLKYVLKRIRIWR